MVAVGAGDAHQEVARERLPTGQDLPALRQAGHQHLQQVVTSGVHTRSTYLVIDAMKIGKKSLSEIVFQRYMYMYERRTMKF